MGSIAGSGGFSRENVLKVSKHCSFFLITKIQILGLCARLDDKLKNRFFPKIDEERIVMSKLTNPRGPITINIFFA